MKEVIDNFSNEFLSVNGLSECDDDNYIQVLKDVYEAGFKKALRLIGEYNLLNKF